MYPFCNQLHRCLRSSLSIVGAKPSIMAAVPRLTDADTAELIEYTRALQRNEALGRDAFQKCQKLAVRRGDTIQELLWDKMAGVQFPLVPPVMPAAAESDTETATGLYRLGKVLGMGIQSFTREGQHSTSNGTFAVKRIIKSNVSTYQHMQRLHNEIKHLSMVNHNNICKLIEVIHAPKNFYIVLEHGGQDLFAFTKETMPTGGALPETQVKSISKQLVAAVSALSAAGIVHHDIKPEKLLIDARGHIRLTGLNLSEVYKNGQQASAYSGSPGFFAPEKVYAESYDPFKVDVWSIGCVMLELHLGRQWFSQSWHPLSEHAADRPLVFEGIMENAVGDLGASLESKGLSTDAINFCLLALTFDPNERPDISVLLLKNMLGLPEGD